MIYVSTSCVKAARIGSAIELLAESGFKNIELSGGTDYYTDIERDILALRDKYSLRYMLHNYFPPPRAHFVLNLASLDDDVRTRTLAHLTDAVLLSRRLNAPRFGFHAGFFADLTIAELGGGIVRGVVRNKKEAVERFCDGFRLLQKAAGGDVTLYVENNVLAGSQAKAGMPFMLVTADDYRSLKKRIDFNLLLDTGHLKVSCRSLSLDFNAEAGAMASYSDYLHFSDNNGLSDEHAGISEGSGVWDAVRPYIAKDSAITLEITGLDGLRRTHDVLMRYLQ